MSKSTSVSLVALISLSLMATACQKKAEGQVVAVVNGEEITLNELNAEIADLNVPPNADRKAVRADVLSRMVDRRLLAQAAKDAGLDRDPAYISQERRLKERLLVSMYGRKAFDTISVPDNAKLDQYMAAHPGMFGSRQKLVLDQLQFDMPADVSKLKGLDTAHSLTEVGDRLTAMGITFQHGNGQLDTATISADALKRLEALPAGEPFIVPSGNKVIVSVITSRQPVAIPIDQAKPMAVQALRAEELNKIGEQRLSEAKKKAKIEYQPGYEPRSGTSTSSKAMEDAAKGTNALAAPGNAGQ